MKKREARQGVALPAFGDTGSCVFGDARYAAGRRSLRAVRCIPSIPPRKNRAIRDRHLGARRRDGSPPPTRVERFMTVPRTRAMLGTAPVEARSSVTTYWP